MLEDYLFALNDDTDFDWFTFNYLLIFLFFKFKVYLDEFLLYIVNESSLGIESIL